jgi:transposase
VLTPPPDDDHDCGWKAYAREQERKLAKMHDRLEQLERALYAKRSEKRKRKPKPDKLPPPVPAEKAEPGETERKRRDNAVLRDAACVEEEEHIAAGARTCGCSTCGGSNLETLGEKSSVIYEYVQGHFRKRRSHLDTVKCLDCGTVERARTPQRFGEKSRYGPGFVAHLIYSKWSLSMPQARLERAYRAIGIPISRSTMCDLSHRGASELAPIYSRMCEDVRSARDVHADETTMRQKKSDRKSFVWVFVSPDVTVYRYAATRSGSVPAEMLGDSPGCIVVDQYTGYNKVTALGGRVRAGCLAHARRKLYEQRKHPEMEEALDLIGAIYQVERDAKKDGADGAELLRRRVQHSRPLFARLLCWARRHARQHEPRSEAGKAIRYLLKYWRELGVFLRRPTIPPDNNIAENALRRVVVGRSNYLFVDNERTGQNHAILYSIIATCERHGVNPLDYLADVLMRVQHHPASRIDELLPHRWKPPDPPAAI